jgi:hypothetical protein
MKRNDTLISMHFVGNIRMLAGIVLLFHFTHKQRNHFTWNANTNTSFMSEYLMKSHSRNAGEAISYWIEFSEKYSVDNRESYETA